MLIHIFPLLRGSHPFRPSFPQLAARRSPYHVSTILLPPSTPTPKPIRVPLISSSSDPSRRPALGPASQPSLPLNSRRPSPPKPTTTRHPLLPSRNIHLKTPPILRPLPIRRPDRHPTQPDLELRLRARARRARLLPPIRHPPLPIILPFSPHASSLLLDRNSLMISKPFNRASISTLTHPITTIIKIPRLA
jgi:hypothetical protein